MKVPALDTSVFIIPGERVKNGDERLVVLNRVAKSVVESQRGKHPNPCVRAGTEGRRTETGGEDEQHRPEVGPRACGGQVGGGARRAGTGRILRIGRMASEASYGGKSLINWRGRRDSNPRPPGSKPGTLSN